MPEPESPKDHTKPAPQRKVSSEGNSQNGSSPTQPWVWLMFVVIAAAVLWALRPGNEVKVDYGWFQEQVSANNIQEFSNQSTKVYGRLGSKISYKPSG